MKKITILFLFISIFLSCDSIRVSSDYNKDIDFSNLKTYAFSKQGVDKVKINDIDKKRILVPCPLPIAELSARFFEILPKPIITRDQLRLLKYDNIASGKYKTNSDIGMPSKRYFNDEVKKYCYMWREGGQFSTEKYTSTNDLENKPSKN